MFLVEYHNGTITTENDTTWKALDDSVPIRMVLLSNNNIVVGLVDMDTYWFSNQAVAVQGDKGKLIAQIIGGKKDDRITEIVQSATTGNVGVFSEDKFLIKTDHKNGRMPDESSKGKVNLFARIFRGLK